MILAADIGGTETRLGGGIAPIHVVLNADAALIGAAA